jgi:uncharacterized protein (DUF3084 family)
MPDPLILPELARSLRSLGAPRGVEGDAAHGAIFPPLLEARARATLGDVEDALAAFRGGPLGARIQARVVDAASAGQSDAARARARAARATELLDALLADLTALDAAALQVRGGSADLAGWQAWVAQLRRVFATADDACRALARLLAERPPEPARSRRWFGR